MTARASWRAARRTLLSMLRRWMAAMASSSCSARASTLGRRPVSVRLGRGWRWVAVGGHWAVPLAVRKAWIASRRRARPACSSGGNAPARRGGPDRLPAQQLQALERWREPLRRLQHPCGSADRGGRPGAGGRAGLHPDRRDLAVVLRRAGGHPGRRAGHREPTGGGDGPLEPAEGGPGSGPVASVVGGGAVPVRRGAGCGDTRVEFTPAP